MSPLNPAIFGPNVMLLKYDFGYGFGFWTVDPSNPPAHFDGVHLGVVEVDAVVDVFSPSTRALSIRSFIRFRQRRNGWSSHSPDGPISAVIPLPPRSDSTRCAPRGRSSVEDRHIPDFEHDLPRGFLFLGLARRLDRQMPRLAPCRPSPVTGCHVSVVSISSPLPVIAVPQHDRERVHDQDGDEQHDDGSCRVLPASPVRPVSPTRRSAWAAPCTGPGRISTGVRPVRGRQVARDGAHEQQRCGLAERPGQREDRAREDARAPRRAARGSARPPTAWPRRRTPPPGCSFGTARSASIVIRMTIGITSTASVRPPEM